MARSSISCARSRTAAALRRDWRGAVSAMLTPFLPVREAHGEGDRGTRWRGLPPSAPPPPYGWSPSPLPAATGRIEFSPPLEFPQIPPDRGAELLLGGRSVRGV